MTIEAGGRRQVAEVRSGGSYISQNDLRVHFGLGAGTSVDRLTITPTGMAMEQSGMPESIIFQQASCDGDNRCRASGGFCEVEIMSAGNWWKRPGDEVLRICKERHATVV